MNLGFNCSIESLARQPPARLKDLKGSRLANSKHHDLISVIAVAMCQSAELFAKATTEARAPFIMGCAMPLEFGDRSQPYPYGFSIYALYHIEHYLYLVKNGTGNNRYRTSR